MRSGSSRFAVALFVSGVIKVLAAVILAAGIISATYTFNHSQGITTTQRRAETAGAIFISSLVVASFIATIAYIVHILVAIYDEVRMSPTAAPTVRYGPPAMGAPPAYNYQGAP